MGICGSVPLTEEEAKNSAVVKDIFGIWGGAMMSKDASKLDAMKPYGASGMTFDSTMKQVEATREIFTIEPGPDNWVAFMKDIFMTRKMEPITATLLPSGSFMQGLNAFGNQVTFKNVLKGYRVESLGTEYTQAEPFIEHHKLTFTADNKIASWDITTDKALTEKMGPILWKTPATAA